MNILFFLTPKSEVSFIMEDESINKALKTLRKSGFTAVPMLDKDGHFKGTLTEGDFLWNLIDKHNDINITKHDPVSRLHRRMRYRAVNINEDIDNLLNIVYTQNFVPIVDDRKIFIGIVTRQDVLKHYCNEHCLEPAIYQKKQQETYFPQLDQQMLTV